MRRIKSILCEDDEIASYMIRVYNTTWSCTSLSADEVHDLVLPLTRNTGIRQEDLGEGKRIITYNNIFKSELTIAET